MRSVIAGRRAGVLGLAVGALVTLAACGSGGSGGSGGPGGGAYGGAASTSPATQAPATPAPTTPAPTTPAPAAAGGGGYKAPPGAARTSGTGSGTSSGAVLSTRATSLGTVVVDARGMTVYEFGKDTMGATTSACTGGCATLWPEVHAGSGTPQVSGVTGAVGTITGTDGQAQVTLDGWPLYTFVHDTAPGDTTGQNYMNLWWALTPAGQRVG